MPEISVIIPVYQVERYLHRSLDSLLAQTYSDWEAVCVNDGSTDESAKILSKYAKRDSRFKVLSQPNSGVSVARNLGMSHATGRYVVYLDSDDLIHPQTLEISHALAQRDDSDIVTWYKDPNFRPQLLVRHKLGFKTDNVLPRGIDKHYETEQVKSYTTDDIFAHFTEDRHLVKFWPVKHFYVWCHLFKRELIRDIQFIPGLIFEDFPWWSEVLLKNPRVTITHLPFYYYFPNFNSIDLSSTRVRKLQNWIAGLEHTWLLYNQTASPYQYRQWSALCKWPVINYQIAGNLRDVTDPNIKRSIRTQLQRLWELGAFNDPVTRGDLRNHKRLSRFLQEGER